MASLKPEKSRLNYLLEPSGTFFWVGRKQRVFLWSEISSAFSSHCVKQLLKNYNLFLFYFFLKEEKREKRPEFSFHSLVINK
jgi:restriction endonuclease S subunit